MAGWMLYAMVVGALLAAAAWAAERSAHTRRAPARLYWSLAIVGAVMLPIVIATVSIQMPSMGGASAPAAPAAPLALRQLTAEALSLPPVAPAPQMNVWLTAGWVGASAVLALGIAVQGWLLLRSKASWSTARLAGVEVLVSEKVGPAVVGLLQPRIVVPRWVVDAGVDDRALIVAHERSHLDADDARLLAIAVLLVVCMPWNLPLWWSLRRLRRAIEVDCDARVLRGGGDARRYGETLLMVGARHSSTLAVVAAMSEPRSNLEQRLLRMVSRPTKFAWASGAALAGVSLMFAAAAAAVSPPNREASQRIVAVDRATLERYAGFYDANLSVFVVAREGDHLSIKLTGQQAIAAYPKGDGAFAWGAMEVRFALDGSGAATTMALRKDGVTDEVMPRMSEVAAAKFQSDILARIESNQPTPGAQAALAHAVTAMMSGAPDYDQMEPRLARSVREVDAYQATLSSLGPVRSLAFAGVGPAGNDVYIARHARGASRWEIGLNSEGKIRSLRSGMWP